MKNVSMCKKSRSILCKTKTKNKNLFNALNAMMLIPGFLSCMRLREKVETEGASVSWCTGKGFVPVYEETSFLYEEGEEVGV